MGQMLRVRLVSAVLETAVLLDGDSVGETDVESGILKAIDQPIPVVSRLDRDACQFVLPASEKANDLRKVVRQSLLRDNPVGIVNHGDNAIVGMQINPAVHHLRLHVPSDSATSEITSVPQLRSAGPAR